MRRERKAIETAERLAAKTACPVRVVATLDGSIELWKGRRKVKTLSLGTYPTVSLKDARERRDELRRQLAQGIDPGLVRKACKVSQANTFEALAAVIRRIEARGALDTAHRALANYGQVFRYAVATGRAERDPSGDLRGVLPPCEVQAPCHYNQR